jgi:hypothetical protein
MIDLRTDNNEEPLDLDATAKISMTVINPALDKDRSARGFSLPFTLPATPRNMRLRKHSNRLDGKRLSPQGKSIIRYGSHVVADGILKPLSLTATNEEVAFQTVVTDVWADLERFKISEILDTLPLDYVGSVAQWVFQFAAAPNTYSLSLPNVTATATANGSSNFDRDLAGFNLAQQLNAVVPGIAGYSGGILTLASVIVNTNPVTQTVSMTLLSATTIGSLAQENMRQHVNDVVLNGAATHAFPCIHWNDFYAATSYQSFFRFTVNAWSDGELHMNEARLESPFFDWGWENTVVPMVRVPYILEKIREKIGYESWQGAFWASQDFQELLAINNYSLDYYYRDRNLNDEVEEVNGYLSEIDLNKHVPELTAADFLRKICNTFDLELRPRGKSLMFIPNIDQITAAPIDMTLKATSAFQRFVTDPAGWSLVYEKNPAETEVPINGQMAEVVKAPGKNVTLVVPTMPFHTLPLWQSGNAKMPRTKQPGVSGVFQTERLRSSMPLTFLFYRGLGLTTTGASYPFATHDNKALSGELVGQRSLDISGPYGLFETAHKGHIELSDADVIHQTFTLHAGDIERLQSWENARIRVYNPLGEYIGVIESLSYELGLDGVAPTKAVVRKQG